MRVCLLFGMIMSAAFCMLNSRDYAEFHAYMIDFVQGAAIWAAVAVDARAVWRVTSGGGCKHRERRTLSATLEHERPTPKLSVWCCRSTVNRRSSD